MRGRRHEQHGFCRGWTASATAGRGVSSATVRAPYREAAAPCARRVDELPFLEECSDEEVDRQDAADHESRDVQVARGTFDGDLCARAKVDNIFN